MQTIALDTKESSSKFFAFIDAKRKSTINATHYTDRQKLRAEQIKSALDIMYDSHSYIEFRKKWIAIKLDKPVVRDMHMLEEFEELWSNEGLTKVITSQGITYRIPQI